MPVVPYEQQNQHVSDDDNDVDDDDEILDSDAEDLERMSFLGGTSLSNRGPTNGGGNSSNLDKPSTLLFTNPYRSKRLCLLFVATSLLIMVVIGRFTSFTQKTINSTDTTQSYTNATIDDKSKTDTKKQPIGTKTKGKKIKASSDASTKGTAPPKVLEPIYALPKTNEQLLPGYKKPTSEVSDTYIRRAKQTLTAEQQQELNDTWGYWNWTHPPPLPHTTAPPPYNQYPNQDIPRSAFPTGSWQTDPLYLQEFLPHSIQYIERCLEAILGEYGNSKFDHPDKSIWDRAWMFDITTSGEKYNLKNPMGNAGFGTPATLGAIKKRIVHALMTENSFTFVMGGHSAAAGHGNHFQQSYTLQVQRVLEPILARIGITHKSHNFGMGGLGTIQNALGMLSLYGNGIDVLMWDSSMTEGDAPSKDLFARIGILSGTKKVPVLWGQPDGGRYDSIAPGTGSIQTGFWGMCSCFPACCRFVLHCI
jgi:hypothetical protein